MNLAVRLPQMRRPVAASIGIGLLFTLMMLTKTTAVFLLPALAWAMLMGLRRERRSDAALLAGGAGDICGVRMGCGWRTWCALGLMADYRFLYYVNDYAKPKEIYWPLVSAIWSFHGGLWADHILIPLAGLLVVTRGGGMVADGGARAVAGSGVWGKHLGGGRVCAFHDDPESSPTAVLCGGGVFLFHPGGARGGGDGEPGGGRSHSGICRRRTSPVGR